eukprot:CAMPEP_0179117352 /NCGR_PEP_ID=MMETSP0796-20121207/55114_1 /TAXON_ID=73915 /ORGANISM="Pyrodinium bahamense, Strain pbaha01" /LENGTH=347 /DNA_ID=CAMNT_0020815717 /DNA_START=37 /DNA_END=1080 /DNA_ORIENTATION=-
MAETAPVSYEEDAEAQGDGTILFAMMDQDVSGYLDSKELSKARSFLLASFSGTMGSDTVDGLLNCSDDNNDGKVNSAEWHDFLRSIYEVLGRKRFKDGVRSWKATLYSTVQNKHKARATKAQTTAATVRRTKTAPGAVGAVAEAEAATRIQAHVRGRQARKRATRRRRAATTGLHDETKMRGALEAGRHLITVISQDADHGVRADFYMDGEEIEFTVSDGDRGRGVQVVTLDPDTRKVLAKRCYDVSGEGGEEANRRLAKDLDALPLGVYVLLAVKGSGLKDLGKAAIRAMSGIGACFDGLGKRDTGYALIGCKGYEASAERHGRKAEAEAAVSFAAEKKGERLRSA